jgi:FkbM family methyltransferase
VPNPAFYAQNGEDVRLARVFPDIGTGCYVDLGAGDPVIDSVTLHFYEQGWSGINIEPDSAYFRALKVARPRDITIEAACGSWHGLGMLHAFDAPGLSSLSHDVLQWHETHGRDLVSSMPVMVLPLEEIFQTYVTAQVDFLKIDVEGFELEVLESFDLARWAPRVVVVEATFPTTERPTWDAWEWLLVRAKYRRACFDGINCFYAQDQQLCEVLAEEVGT